MTDSDLDEVEEVHTNDVEQKKLEDAKDNGDVDDPGDTPVLNILGSQGPPPPPDDPPPPPPGGPTDEKAREVGEKVQQKSDPEEMGREALKHSNNPNGLVERAQQHGGGKQEDNEVEDEIEHRFGTTDPDKVPDTPIEQPSDTSQPPPVHDAPTKSKPKRKRKKPTRSKKTRDRSQQAKPNKAKHRRKKKKRKHGRRHKRPDTALRSKRVKARGHTAKEGESESPEKHEMAEQGFEATENVGEFTALFGNKGQESTGHNAVGNLSGWGKDDAGDWKRENENIAGTGDIIGGTSELGGGTMGFIGGFNRFTKKKGAEKAQGGFEMGSGVGKMFAGSIKSGAGILDIVKKTGEDSGKLSEESAKAVGGASESLKVVGASSDVVADSVGLMGTAVETGRNLRKFVGPGRKTWKQASKATRARRVGNAIERVAKLGSGVTKIGNNAAKLAQQGAHHVTSGPNVVGQWVLAPVGLAVSTYEGGKNIASMVTAGKNRSRLTKQMDNFKTKKDRKTGRHFVDEEELDQMHMLDHLHKVNKKRQGRAGLNLATNAMSAAGSIMTMSGMGAVGGMVAGGAAAVTKLGAMAVRKGKQHGRDKKAKKLQKYRDLHAQGKLSKKKQKVLRSMDKDEKKHQYQELRKRAKKNRVSKSEWQTLTQLARDLSGNQQLTDPINQFKLSRKQRISLAFRFDTNKSSGKKKEKNLRTAETLLQLWKDVDANQGPNAPDPFKIRVKKAERWKAARSGMGVDSKKWAHIVANAKNDQALLKEILKQMGKRE